MLVNSSRFDILNVWPMLGKIVFHNRWQELIQLRQSQEDVLIAFIRSRRKVVKRRQQGRMESDKESLVAYVDTLLDLELPDEKRKLNEKEMVSLCSEFLDAGTDKTSTALQWIMANLVKYPHVQTKVYEEIHGIVGPSPQFGEKNENIVMIKEDDLQRMLYLKSVVLEGRRICPAAGMVMLHLEFFLANLVWYFEWTAMEGDAIDLSKKQEFTTVMKYPLQTHIFPRGLSQTL
ncbi:hypothetical protein RHMOL_Rhmol03G0248500 [Rhododendron molle]|uniref:Uncharacterized protein n=1 Tax=Rhododendron molle TaxID=49168 RepID=A0ACC0PKG7_RHOML|nr:hypothetical protein RHMOL_Rhmol03G0248500 [Rhododendron molle]